MALKVEGQGWSGQPQQDQGSPSATAPRSRPSVLRWPFTAGTRPPLAREPDRLHKASAWTRPSPRSPARRLRQLSRGAGWPEAHSGPGIRARPGGRERPTPTLVIFGDSALNPHPMAQGHMIRGDSGLVGLPGPDTKSLAGSGAQEA